MIKRGYYLEQLTNNMWNGEVKVITGLRRSGKSTLLFKLFKNNLIASGVKEKNIITYELDQRKYYKYRNPILLSSEVEAIVSESQDKYYLFIDEVQFSKSIKDKENNDIEVTIYDMLNELKSYENLDVYVTGSNSKMLSIDIMTEFRGRSTQIHIYPLSFKEYYQYLGGNKQERLNEYLLYGGLPRVTMIKQEADKKKYLSSLFEELYIKDVLERHRIKKTEILNSILDYLSSQIGSLTNPTNIANVLSNNRKEKINYELVSSYIDHLIDAFIIAKAKRYDIKGKSYFRFPNKYYFTDLGLRNSKLNYRQYDPGHLMENVIYNELIKRGYSVDVGVVVDRRKGVNINKEIDFVVNNGDKRVYIQSALRIDDEVKKKSELDSFALTKDFFKKVIVRNDISHNYYDDNGVYHCNLVDFLLNDISLF